MMKDVVRQRILRVNAVFLAAFGVSGLFAMDLPGVCCSAGPVGAIIRSAPDAGIGFVEAHGLAIVIAAWMAFASRRVPERSWHVGAAAAHLLLGVSNVVFWHVFAAGDIAWLGWLVTPPHFVFAVVEIVAAASAHGSAVPRTVGQCA
jgi:hypothetical protein